MSENNNDGTYHSQQYAKTCNSLEQETTPVETGEEEWISCRNGEHKELLCDPNQYHHTI